MALLNLAVEINPAVTDRSFAVASEGYAKVAAVPQNLEASVEDLGGGAYLVHNVAGQNQNTLVVEFKDHLVAVEAPGAARPAVAIAAGCGFCRSRPPNEDS
jgi:hypothetical protein